MTLPPDLDRDIRWLFNPDPPCPERTRAILDGDLPALGAILARFGPGADDKARRYARRLLARLVRFGGQSHGL